MENDTNLVEQRVTWLNSLFSASAALREAEDDAARMKIRDFGKGIEAAAQEWDVRPVQVQASLLVQDAERAIAKANPPQKHGGDRKGKEHKINVILNNVDFPVKRSNLWQMRLAHDKLKDSEYEDIKAKAITSERPLTRKFLIDSHKNNGFMARATGEYEWYTPADYIECVHAVLGEIDLDPASSEQANEIVKAHVFYDKSDDGLKQAWKGKAFMNPPFQAKLIAPFIEKLLYHFGEEEVTEAVLLVNSCTETAWFQDCLEKASAFCFPSERVKFYTPLTVKRPRQESHRPQTFFYFGDNIDQFVKVFQAKGFTIRR